MNDPYEDQLKAARYKAERDQARQRIAGLMKSVDDLDDENEHLRDMLNDVAWKLGIGREVHYLSGDNYDECHKRVLGEISKLSSPTSYDVAQVTASAYDLLPEDDRKAMRWVRKKGGLDAVRQRWERLSCYADNVPRSCMEKRLARLRRQVDESHAALRRRNQRIALLESEINCAHNENRMEFLRRAGNYTAFADKACKRLAPQLRYVEGCTKDVMDAALKALDSRLMPEGYEWPRYESGEQVRIGDKADLDGEGFEVRYIGTYGDGSFCLNFRSYAKGERVKRPSVIAADGEPLEAGQMVYHLESGDEFTVMSVDAKRGEANLRWGYDFEAKTGSCAAELLTHRRPVLDADGVPIELGDDLYSVEGGLKLHVSNIDRVNCKIATSAMFALDRWADPSMFTHTKPEPPDRWERIEEDLGDEMAKQQLGPISPELACKLAGEFVRRFKALAGVTE